MTKLFKRFAAGAALLAAAPAMAMDDLPVIGKPVDGATGFQPAASELARDLQWLDGMILVIITVITLFVTALMAYCVVRFNRKANPNAASFTHNTKASAVACTSAAVGKVGASRMLLSSGSLP